MRSSVQGISHSSDGTFHSSLICKDFSNHVIHLNSNMNLFYSSEGYGGPPCGFFCLHRQNVTDNSSRIKLNNEGHAEICPTLCRNGLGEFVFM